MGTGVMIGAGILALTGQIAELAGTLFPLVFLAAAVVTVFSAYSYVKLSNAYPSAGGIAMFLQKASGKGVMTAVGALLMYFSMVINQSLVARTFGTYTVQLFNIDSFSWIIPALAVGLLIFAFLLNISGNRVLGMFSLVMAFIKIGAIILFAVAGLWVAEFFDLSRIASLGVIFYLLMDIAIHWGVFRHLRKEINANATILLAAIVFDVIVLGAFLKIKASIDIMVIYIALIGILVIFIGEKLFLRDIKSET